MDYNVRIDTKIKNTYICNDNIAIFDKNNYCFVLKYILL